MKQQELGGLLFYSYAPSDGPLYDRLAQFLRPLTREAHLLEWSVQQIQPGAEFAAERRAMLERATLILLLISPAYLASDICYQEMQDALERQKVNVARVIPVLLCPCDWLATPLSAHAPLPLPSNQKPVISWDKQEEAFSILCRA